MMTTDTDTDLAVEPPGPPEVEPDQLAGPGPGPDGTGERTEPADLHLIELAPQVDEAQVRALLEGLTGAAAELHRDHPSNTPGEPPQLWRMTDVELAAIVPPLTSIINRRPQLARAVQRGEGLTVGMVFAGYTARQVGTLRAYRTEPEPDRPDAGEPAPGPYPAMPT